MKKRLNIDTIGNELRGGSAFFPGYKPGGSPTSLSEKSEDTSVSDRLTTEEAISAKPEPNLAISERPNDRTPERPNGKRIITRNSFEIYEDQMASLRKLSYQEKMDGKIGSMSGMVREALDDYLQKRSSG